MSGWDNKPESICPLEMRWARFLIYNSSDILSWRSVFNRLIWGDENPGNDDDDRGGGRPKVPTPRPLEPSC
jgi:hypothetical protein